MNQPHSHEDASAPVSREEMQSAQFTNMVMQQTNMALMFLGKVPHPETGQSRTDVDTAQMFIDQLEMLEAKTKGNLTKQEEGLLKQSLMTLRMAFVEVIESGGKTAAEEKPAAAPSASAAQPKDEPQTAQKPIESGSTADDGDSRKKFSKKY